MKPVFVLILAAVFCVTAPAADTAKPAGSKQRGKETASRQAIEGVWKAAAAILGGNRVPASSLRAITLKISGAAYEVTVLGEEKPDKGICTYDTNSIPNRMTIKCTDGPNQGKTFLAIYEMTNADSMRVCYDLSGTDFPREFTSLKGTELYLVGYRRQKE